jgi:N-acetylglucosamine malate deacetylase 1
MNVLAIGCHPDDLEIGCGGTLAKYARQGHQVFMCHVANGNMGHVVIQPEELRHLRALEAEEAGRVIGAAEVISIDVGDLHVNSYNQDTVSRIVDVVRHVKPDLIITHSPEDYMKDHLEVSRLVYDASFSSSIPHYPSDQPFYPKIAPLYYMDTLAGINFLPTEYVDISETIDIKLDAVNRHQSQVKWMLEHDHIDFLDFVRTISKFRGIQCGAAFAEGFRKCETWPRISTARQLP